MLGGLCDSGLLGFLRHILLHFAVARLSCRSCSWRPHTETQRVLGNEANWPPAMVCIVASMTYHRSFRRCLYKLPYNICCCSRLTPGMILNRLTLLYSICRDWKSADTTLIKLARTLGISSASIRWLRPLLSVRNFSGH